RAPSLLNLTTEAWPKGMVRSRRTPGVTMAWMASRRRSSVGLILAASLMACMAAHRPPASRWAWLWAIKDSRREADNRRALHVEMIAVKESSIVMANVI